ncbi:MAG: amidohydrolase [Salinivirgaceae bacterium]|nr:amidohydrolase [Salinivirgaceae bacterium]
MRRSIFHVTKETLEFLALPITNRQSHGVEAFEIGSYLQNKVNAPIGIFMRTFLVFIAVLFLFNGCNSAKQVDLLLVNGTIYTVDSLFSIAETMAVADGKIVAVGDQSLLKNFEADSIIDLQGKSIYPGFIDAHCHFYGYCMTLSQIDLRGTKSYDDMLNRLRKWDAENNPEWITGRGWDQNNWPEPLFPHKRELDKLFPEKPVFLRRIDGHAAIANSKALEIAGITANTKIRGGEVLLENGEPTGILIDKAMEQLMERVPKLSKADMEMLLHKGAQSCYDVGLTTVADAGLTYDEVMLMDSLQKNGQLAMQVYAMLLPTERNFSAFVHKGVYRTPKMHIKSIKLFADGALGSRGACLLEPYTDDTDNTGLILEDLPVFDSIMELAYKYNYQVNTHAIGDSANRLILQKYGSVLKGKNDRRWRIEHAQVIHPDDFQLFAKYDIVPAVNTTHATSDMYWAESRLGAERIKGAYAYMELLDQNGWLCNGSDFPVEHINPIYGFFAAVARKDFDGFPDKGFQMDNSLTRSQALKSMTIWAAKSIFEEERKGSLEPGKQADFVVLDSDIMDIDIMKVPDVQVLESYISGEKVY